MPCAGPFSTTNSAAEHGIGPFQPQIVIEQLRGFRRQGEKAQLAALAVHAELCFGKQYVFRVQSQNLGRAKSMHEHQAHDGQIACVVEAGPEARYFID